MLLDVNNEVQSPEVQSQVPTPQTPEVVQPTVTTPGPDEAIANYRRQAEEANAKLNDPAYLAFLEEQEKAKQAQVAEEAARVGVDPGLYSKINDIEAQLIAQQESKIMEQAQSEFRSVTETNGMTDTVAKDYLGFLERTIGNNPAMMEAAVKPGFNHQVYIDAYARSVGATPASQAVPNTTPVYIPGHGSAGQSGAAQTDAMAARIKELARTL